MTATLSTDRQDPLLTPTAWLALVLLLAAANCFDVVATQQALARGIPEANPIALWLITSLGFSGLLLVKLIFATLLTCAARTCRSRLLDGLLLFACAGYSALAGLHLLHLTTG